MGALSYLEMYLVESFEMQNLSRFVGCGWFYAKLTGYARDLGDLLCITLRHPAFFDINIIFKTYTNIPTYKQGLCADGKLGASCNAHGELEISDHLVRIIDKKHEILRTRRNAAQNAHDELDINGLLDIPRLDHEG